jgi:hypothetical protein
MRSWEEVWPVLWQASSEPVESSGGSCLVFLTWKKKFFVGTSAAIDFGVDLSRTIIYLDDEYLDKKLWWYLPILLGAAFAGSYIGKRLLGKIPQVLFKRIVLGLIFIIDTVMLFNELYVLVYL